MSNGDHSTLGVTCGSAATSFSFLFSLVTFSDGANGNSGSGGSFDFDLVLLVTGAVTLRSSMAEGIPRFGSITIIVLDSASYVPVIPVLERTDAVCVSI